MQQQDPILCCAFSGEVWLIATFCSITIWLNHAKPREVSRPTRCKEKNVLPMIRLDSLLHLMRAMTILLCIVSFVLFRSNLSAVKMTHQCRKIAEIFCSPAGKCSKEIWDLSAKYRWLYTPLNIMWRDMNPPLQNSLVRFGSLLFFSTAWPDSLMYIFIGGFIKNHACLRKIETKSKSFNIINQGPS